MKIKPFFMERLEHRRLLNIDFPDFSDSTGIELVGDAKITPEGILRLTSDISPEIGGAWFTLEKQFVSTSFHTSFDFQMHNDEDAGGASGFVFLIQNESPTPPLSSGGGNMGYHGITNSLAVEFDTRRLAFHGDTSDSHISAHSKGQEANSAHESASLGSFDTAPTGITLDDGRVHTAQVKYEPGQLSIYLDDQQSPWDTRKSALRSCKKQLPRP